MQTAFLQGQLVLMTCRSLFIEKRSFVSDFQEENPTMAVSRIFRKYAASENLESCLQIIAEREKGLKVDSCSLVELDTEGGNYTGAITMANVAFRDTYMEINRVLCFCVRPPRNKIMIKKYIIKEDRITGPVAGKGFFKYEIFMYAEILPRMSEVIKSSGLNFEKERLWCDIIGYKNYHTLIFNDLRSEGYEVLDRTKGLDVPTARFTIKEVAKFHAISKYLIIENGIKKGHFPPHYTCVDDPSDVLLSIYKGGLAQLARSMILWGPEWVNVATKIEHQVDIVLDQLKRMNDEPYNERLFQVLNHGDLWTSNLMYKLGPENAPISLRFLDYQNCHVHSLAWDLTHFIYSNVFPKERISGFKSMIQDYHSSLTEYMKLLKIDDSIPTCEEIELEMERFGYYGFVVTAINFSIATNENKSAFSLKDLVEKGFRTDPFHSDVYKGTSQFKESVGMEMFRFAKSGVI